VHAWLTLKQYIKETKAYSIHSSCRPPWMHQSSNPLAMYPKDECKKEQQLMEGNCTLKKRELLDNIYYHDEHNYLPYLAIMNIKISLRMHV
jgi:hypothetical protein